jgi:hypothetical protein
VDRLDFMEISSVSKLVEFAETCPGESYLCRRCYTVEGDDIVMQSSVTDKP